MFQKEVQKLVKQISLKFYIKENEVEEIANSQFKFIRDMIVNADVENHDTFKSTKLLHLFKILPSKERLYHINRRKQLKDENNNRETE